MSTPDATARLNTALSGRYRVERELGQGGMATVYLAADPRHQRNVALKVLKPELSAAVSAERFLSEIRTTATLQHPNILPLFDSGAVDSSLFYTMPYVEGGTLADRLAKGPAFETGVAVRLISDVAEALQVAHERGVVHRDIKPSNILLSRGEPLVADFGIARVVDVSDARLTDVGISLGTVGYMSPEQAVGERDADARADTYSLACVLFEMLTGKPPFGDGRPLAILARQATEPAPSVRTSRPDVPDAMVRAIARALARAPDDRYPTTSEFVASLTSGGPAVARAASAGKTVLVLPFVNRSPDADNEYFSDGLTEEVISDLAGISALSVISRNSAMALKGTVLDSRTIASRHGVTHLVTGSVRKAGSSLRITAELVEASSDRQLLSEKFSGSMDDVFQIQEEIARQIVRALEVRLTDSEERRTVGHPIDNPLAWDCYMKARQLSYSWTAEAQQAALRLVDEAVRHAGETPLLLATRGQIRWNMVNSGVTPAAEGLPDALDLANRALAADPDQYVAIFVRGLVAGTAGQIESAIRDLYRAHCIRPGDLNVLMEFTRWSRTAGLRGVDPYAEQLVRLDPLYAISHLGHAHSAMVFGRLAEAAAPIRRAQSLGASFGLRLQMMIGWILAEAGARDEAVAHLERTAGPASKDPHRAAAMALAHALRGDARRTLEHLQSDAAMHLQSEYDAVILASSCALIGRTADGVAWLRTSVERGHINHPYMNEHSRLLAGLRGSDAFTSLMQEVRPRWDAVVAWEAQVGA